MFTTKRVWTVLVTVAMVASPTWAQDDDDDLAPLAPLAPIGKPKTKAKPKPKPKPKATPKAKTKVVEEDDELAPIAPIAAKGELNVTVPSTLSGAVLSVDGKEIGTLPMAAQSFPTGEHTVTVKRPGYAAFVKKVTVPGGKTITVDAKLTAVAAVLSVSSDVEGAQVLLNGRSIGIAPLRDVEVPAGPAEVAVVKEGFQEDAQKINFVAGKDYPVVVRFNVGDTRTLAASDRPVNANLTPGLTDTTPAGGLTTTVDEPVTSKWYFWVGVGAAVAAVAVGVGLGVNAANTQSPPIVDADRDVCGGMCDGVLNF